MEAGQATKARRTPEVLPLSQVLGSPLRDNEGGDQEQQSNSAKQDQERRPHIARFFSNDIRQANAFLRRRLS